MSTIPTTSKYVDLSLLHPRFKARLEAFFADPQIKGRVSVVSGCRSYATQKRLYDRYKAGKGNLAANPDRKHGANGWWRGSYHMEQKDGYCYAVDFRIVGRGITKYGVNVIAKEYGLVKTVSSEWWHHQPRNSTGWFDAPKMGKELTNTPKNPTKAEKKKVDDALTRYVRKHPLRYRSRHEAVRVMQRKLGALGFDAGPADGIFGRLTRRAVKQYQRANKLVVDGIIGRNTWAALTK